MVDLIRGVSDAIGASLGGIGSILGDFLDILLFNVIGPLIFLISVLLFFGFQYLLIRVHIWIGKSVISTLQSLLKYRKYGLEAFFGEVRINISQRFRRGDSMDIDEEI